METQQPVTSIEALGGRAGALVCRQMESTFRTLLRHPSLVSERRFMRVVTGEPHPFGNLAVVSDTTELGPTMAAIDPLCDCGAPACVVYPIDAVPAEIDAYVRSRGFGTYEPMPAMALDIDALAETRIAEGCELVRVGAGRAGEEWTETLAVGYEIPVAVARMFSPASIGADTASDASFQFFAIHRGSRIVSTSLLHLCDGAAGIYCVATPADERGRGHGAHVTAEPLRMSRDLGYRVGVLQSSPMGQSVYERLGFSSFGEVPLYVRA